MLPFLRISQTRTAHHRRFGAICLITLVMATRTVTALAENGTDVGETDLLVPLAQSGSGSFMIEGEMGGVKSEFLLDTGASMVTINRELFREIRRHNPVEKVRTVGARLASGKVELLDVYQADNFIIGAGCDLGPVEFAVVKQGGRNLLGMNALKQAAPFSISFSPPQLSLSQCIPALSLTSTAKL